MKLIRLNTHSIDGGPISRHGRKPGKDREPRRDALDRDADPAMHRQMTTQTDLFGAVYRPFMIGMIGAILALNLTNAYCVAVKPWVNRHDAIFMLGTEQSPAAWLSSAMLVAAGIACLLCRVTAKGADRMWWMAMTIVIVTMSVDETAGLHERLGDIFNRAYHPTISYGWTLPAIVITLIGLTMFRFVMRLPRKTRLGLIAAFVVFVGSASVIDLFGGLLVMREGNHHYGHYIMESLEENGEMLGELILLITLAGHYRRSGLRLTLSPPAEPPTPTDSVV